MSCGCFGASTLKKKRSPPHTPNEIDGYPLENIMHFSEKDLRLATDDYHPSKKIGRGGFGTVYQGTLKNGRQVAIKSLSAASKQGVREFLTEIKTISHVKHPNLVELVGCCAQEPNRTLVYEYVENNSLDRALLGNRSTNIKLDWGKRSNICTGTARGLAFLHEEAVPHIVHRDIKASNILLDRHFNPKIGDFGLAKLFPDDITHISTRIAGTTGYLAPEYAMGGQLTMKADVYSFGVLILEVISGQSSARTNWGGSNKFLLEWAWQLHEEERLLELVETLIKCGVDASATDRVLLQSLKPSLHTNVDCNALVAAVVHRQVHVVSLLLQNGATTDFEVRLGAWSWDNATGEELRVGAGLGEPYGITWCAVEYFEKSGAILRLLLQYVSNSCHCGRTILHHAILCGNVEAVRILLECGANVESLVKTTSKTEFLPVHMASRLGLPAITQCLIDFGCDLNSRTDSGDTALMVCAKYKQEECLKVLTRAGADFGLVNSAGQSASSIAESYKWSHGFQQVVVDVIRNGKIPKSSNTSTFSPLIFVSKAGDAEALKTVIESGEFDLDYQDDSGFSAAMHTAVKGHVESFRLLVYAGADVKLCNKSGETAITLSELNQKCNLFEKVMLEFTLEKGNQNTGGFYALHCAARRGDLDAVTLLTSKGFDVNVPDGEDYTPLMLAAREGHASLCKLLISYGAHCNAKNARGETALLLARKFAGGKNDAEGVILDELARRLVLGGAYVQKHTKCGKGNPHVKQLRMLRSSGVLCWGQSSRRNVLCREALLGPSSTLRRNRHNTGDSEEPGMFRVLTNKNREVHFVCEGGSEAAKLWVRGIKLVTRGV